jgi:hypothetical protein
MMPELIADIGLLGKVKEDWWVRMLAGRFAECRHAAASSTLDFYLYL